MDIDIFAKNIDKLLDYTALLERLNLEYITKIDDLKNLVKLKNLELNKALKINLEYERKKKEYKLVKDKLEILLNNLEDISLKYFS